MRAGPSDKLLGVKNGDAGALLLWVAAALCAVLIGVAVLNSVFSLCVVVGGSMLPGLHDEQFVLLYNRFEPERGDIVVFYSDELGEDVIKRVVAVGGDTVELRYDGDGYLDLYVNGKRQEEEYINERMTGAYIGEDTALLPGRKIVVEEGKYFVLGDNRNHSTDSRSALIGQVSREDMVGELAAVLSKGNITEFFVRLLMGGFKA